MPTHEILLFASLRERARAETITVQLPATATIEDLLREIAATHPALADLLTQCRVALDQAFVDRGTRIGEAAEIALIPPVSGGHDGDPRFVVTATPLSLDAVVRLVAHEGAGGLTTFTGNVRRHSHDETIDHLDYEAYVPMAERVMAEIAAAIESRIEGSRLAIHHRVGRLVVGETAVVIAASAPHRAEAFAACREAIEALKRQVPIWKRETSVDGNTWFGQGP
jgi:molybdopterin synthase catalytic subunit